MDCSKAFDSVPQTEIEKSTELIGVKRNIVKISKLSV
jgi:hypothetical protein